MANRFWVGGGSSSSWDATGSTNWSATSGGANNASVPTSADDVFFNASSPSGVILVVNPACRNLTCTGYTGSLTSTLRVSGTVNLGSTGTFTSLDLSMNGTGTLTTNGKAIRSLSIGNSGSAATLADALTCSQDVRLTQGTLNLGNQNVTCRAFLVTGTTARTLTMGSGTISLSGSGTVWDASVTTNLTLTANTSTIKSVYAGASAVTFAGGGKTYSTVWIPAGGTGDVTISGSNTFADLKVDGPRIVLYTAGTTQTVTTFTGTTGSSAQKVTHKSTSDGSTWSISKASGAVTRNWLDLRDSVAGGGATWAAANSNDLGGNSGWTITGPPGAYRMFAMF